MGALDLTGWSELMYIRVLICGRILKKDLRLLQGLRFRSLLLPLGLSLRFRGQSPEGTGVEL